MVPRLIMKLDVAEVRHEPGDVLLATLTHPRRPLLPAATAGAHVDVHLGDGRVRHYSLWGDPADRSAYRIAVKREAEGRGGSRRLHELLVPGASLMVSAPRNHFALPETGGPVRLLAGGIGITPLLAMAQVLAAGGRAFHLHVFARRRATAPLIEEARRRLGPGRVSAHLDDEPDTRVALPALLAAPEPGAVLACCGPAGFMAAVRDAAAHWPEEALLFEAFQPLADESFVPEPFEIVLASGRRLAVPADRSALDVLREAGVAPPASCETGVCGSCLCGYRDGTPIHRDVVLSPRARRGRFAPCVSRAVGTLHLDL
ncbi:PDR/VanB family oxidoreductase [Methylobacterium oryzihabitans]|uniref:Oxidoreductase n=1 Tax=Methylobacterium oryzihabitans TaxID=2499852 RepID=A0A437P4M2_9HYPH|nr:PDR/VanB family oxidoreductase [Methylobacterium oryzihabitans]RVU17225.1 oxidoreductase [Methylobacterium oryzihabitans]